MTRMRKLAMDQVLTSFVMAVIIFIVARIGGLELWLAAGLAGVMVVYGLILLALRKSEALEVLTTPGRDERTYMLHLKASAVAGNVVGVLTVGAFLWSLAHGDSSLTPWVTVASVFGVSYLVAAVFFMRRG